MGIELDRDPLRNSVRVALARQIAIWRGEHYDIPERLSYLITELLFDVAGKTVTDGPEKGIIEGLAMIRNWQD